METVIKTVIEMGRSSNGPLQYVYGLIAAVVFIYYIRLHYARHRHVFDAKKIRVDKINNYIDKNLVECPVLRKALIAERDDQIFYHIYGYRLDSGRRRLLTPIVIADDSPTDWASLKAARGYLRVRSGRIEVVISKFDKFDYWMKSGFAFFLFLSAYAVAMLMATNTKATVAQLGSSVIVILTLIAMSVGILFSTFGFSTARRIDRWLYENRMETNQ